MSGFFGEFPKDLKNSKIRVYVAKIAKNTLEMWQKVPKMTLVLYQK